MLCYTYMTASPLLLVGRNNNGNTDLKVSIEQGNERTGDDRHGQTHNEEVSCTIVNYTACSSVGYGRYMYKTNTRIAIYNSHITASYFHILVSLCFNFINTVSIYNSWIGPTWKHSRIHSTCTQETEVLWCFWADSILQPITLKSFKVIDLFIKNLLK